MKKILLIEDNKDVRENTAEILALANYNVITAVNGKEGVEIALKEIPDVIICDIMMPVLDGYGVLHLLSKNVLTSSIPFIFLTAKTEHADYRKGMEMGSDDYITKPFDEIQLLNAIEVRLKKVENFKKQIDSYTDNSKKTFDTEKFIETLKDPTQHEREIRGYKKKDPIYKEGAFAKGVYFIKSGKVKTYQTNDFGKELITGLYNEGQFFGFLHFFNNQPYNETATAIEDAEIILISNEECKTLIHNHPEISEKFIKALANNVIEIQKKLIHLAYDSVRKRVSETLVELSEKYKKQNETQININIGRDDLAHIVGTATETVIRVLTDFKADKYIDIAGSSIIILNLQKLIDMRN
jgi:CRP-like cAMP-binding protein/CheY-like chemotaxis protein